MSGKETANKNLAEYLKAWSDYNHAERIFLTAGENLRRTCDRLNGLPATKQKKGGKDK
jgi:hypothetical protein